MKIGTVFAFLADMEMKMRRFVQSFLKNHRVMTVATIRPDGFPQATTVVYANDGLHLYFACDKSSQKVKNIRRCNKVSWTVDGEEDDWTHMKALSMGGYAEVMTSSQDVEKASGLLMKKYPDMKEMSDEDLAETAFVKVTPKVISVINYELGFGHTDLVKVSREDLRPERALRRVA